MKSRVPKWLVVVTLMSLVCLVAIYLAIPLPPPKVALNIAARWVPDGSNTVVHLSFTNIGPTRVAFSDQMWQVVIESRHGRVTNRAPFASVVGSWIDSGEREFFSVLLPADTVQWQVLATYHYYRRRDAHHDAWALIDRTGFWEHAPEFASDAASWCLDFLWRRTDAEGVIHTPFFTNLPPVQATAPE